MNGILGDVDELHLFKIGPETIPERRHNLFAKFKLLEKENKET